MNDGAEVELFGGQAGEAIPEIEAGLATENREGAGAGAVGAFLAVPEDVPKEVEVLLHGLRMARDDAIDKSQELQMDGFTPRGPAFSGASF